MRRVRIGLVLAGLLLGQQACSGAAPAPVAPAPSASSPLPPAPTASVPSSPAPGASSSSSPAPSATASSSAAGRGPLSGTRQVFLLPAGSEATVAVGRSGALELSEDFGERALFVITEVEKDRYWIRTAKLRSGGEALCLSVRKGTPGSVVTAACDAGADEQLFRFRKTGYGPRYTIRIDGDIYLVTDERGELGSTAGVAAVPIGEGTPDIDTPFLLPDRGPAHLPALD